MADGRIALVNQGTEELRMYAPDGTFLFAAGREGDGPGEFRNAFHLFRTAGDTLWVGDYWPWEFEVFGPTGEWVRGVRPSPTQPDRPPEGGILSDGRAVLGFDDRTRRSAAFTVAPLHVLLYAANGGVLDTLHVGSFGRWGQLDGPSSTWIYPWFEARTELAARGDRYVIGHGSAPELQVYRLDADPRLERIVRWTGVDQSVGPSDVAAARAELEARYVDAGGSPAAELALSDDRPVAEIMPVMRDVQLGADGTIWIQEFPRPTDATQNRWIRFDGTGRLTCRLALPPGLEVYEFGSDYVLGLGEGEFRAEQVMLYRLVLPASGD